MQVQEKYDIIILGTGIVESILAALLSQKHSNQLLLDKRVLVIDRSSVYGGESKCQNLRDIFDKNKKEKNIFYGDPIEWNINSVLKLAYCEDRLTKFLLHTNTSEYIEWKSIEATFMGYYREKYVLKKGLKIYRIPSTSHQGAHCDFLGFSQKRHYNRFLEKVMYHEQYKISDERFTKFNVPQKKIDRYISINQNFIRFKCKKQDFNKMLIINLGNYEDERYKYVNISDWCNRAQLYRRSMLTQFGSTPYIYPQYGLATLSQVFLRKVVLNKGKIKLQTNVQEFILKNNRVRGIKTLDGKSYYAPMIISDPSYVKDCGHHDHVYSKQKIIRCLCILDHQIKQIEQYQKQYHSGFITIPGKTRINSTKFYNRKTNIYILFLSNTHKVCKNGYFIVLIVAKMQNNQDPEKVIQYPLSLLGQIKYKDIDVRDRYVPFGSIDDQWYYPNGIMDDQWYQPQDQKKLYPQKKLRWQEEETQQQKEERILKLQRLYDQRLQRITQQGPRQLLKKFKRQLRQIPDTDDNKKVKKQQNIDKNSKERRKQQKKPIPQPPQNPIKGLYISKNYSFYPFFNYQIDDALDIYEYVTGQSGAELNKKILTL